MNRDLVLREYFAIERTKSANETTLLAYVRTGLYFLVADSTLGQLVETTFWSIMGIPLIVVGLIVMAIGFIRFVRLRRSIGASKRNIGNASETFIKVVTGSRSHSNEPKLN